MKYEDTLIGIDTMLEIRNGMYSVVLLRASSLTITLSGTRCFVDGDYLLCLSSDDTVTVHGGHYDAKNLRFLPYFYNINLSHSVIGHTMYDTMRREYGYPDFHLFIERNDRFCGIISISADEYELVRMHFELAERHINAHITDRMWSCRTRSDIISILRIAESAYLGIDCGEENEIIRYIRENIGGQISLDLLCRRFSTNRTTLSRTVKELTGRSPMQYVLEERLNQSRPDLLFTDIPIGEIAVKYGFLDDNYYIRAFKKHFGKPPLQYRIDGRAERIRNQEKYRLKG